MYLLWKEDRAYGKTCELELRVNRKHFHLCSGSACQNDLIISHETPLIVEIHSPTPHTHSPQVPQCGMHTWLAPTLDGSRQQKLWLGRKNHGASKHSKR